MKPIIFNTEMVQAILEGRKTMARRVVKYGKRTPLADGRDKFYKIDENLNGENPNRLYAGFYKDSDVFESNGKTLIDALYYPLYFNVGDILWVRETWQDGSFLEDNHGNIVDYIYKADDDKGINSYSDWGIKWRPSIHMPKKAARIFLKVVDIRVERVQDITEMDAWKEGCPPKYIPDKYPCSTAWFHNLWQGLNKKRGYGWDENPWVWVYEFERVDKP